MNDLALIEREILELSAQLRELRTAANVLRGLRGGARKQLGGISAIAAEILSESKEPIYYKDLADMALKRGYKARATSSVDTVRASFWSMMKRRPELFEAVGDGYFRLAAAAEGGEG